MRKKKPTQHTFTERYDIESRLHIHHRQFVDELLSNGHNATKAYSKIYPKANKTTARSNAAQLMAKPDVKAYYEAQVRTLMETAQPGLMDRVINQLTEIAFMSPMETSIDKHGKQRRVYNIGKHKNSLRALELLAKYLKILGEQSPVHVEKMYVLNSEEYNAL